MSARPIRHVRIAIVGSGFAGIGTAIRLKQQGCDDFVVLERSADLGGVWRDNTYPGCACDVESHLYSFSFAPNPGWTRLFAPAHEIHEYLRDCAVRFGVLDHVSFGQDVRAAVWDDGDARWRIDTARESLTADVLVAANGALSDPAIPRLPGLDRFEGAAFHSARWRHDVDLARKSVAVVGTGASAVQFVPAIQPGVAKLHLFQRTPAWVLPRRDRPISATARRVYATLPVAQRVARAVIGSVREMSHVAFRMGRATGWVERTALRHLRQSVADPALRAKLTPTYRIGCKRILLSDDYFPSLTRANIEVVTESIREVRARSIVTADGVERAIDAIVFGTGFRVAAQPMSEVVRGRDGRTLADAWNGSPKAYLGTMVAGFPNLFLLQGPNTGLGHTSVVLMIEAQIEHVLTALRYLGRSGAGAIEPSPRAQAAFVADVDERMRGTVWSSGGCASWYIDATGRNSALWPDPVFRFRQRLARFDPASYVVTARAERACSRARSGARAHAGAGAASTGNPGARYE